MLQFAIASFVRGTSARGGPRQELRMGSLAGQRRKDPQRSEGPPEASPFQACGAVLAPEKTPVTAVKSPRPGNSTACGCSRQESDIQVTGEYLTNYLKERGGLFGSVPDTRISACQGKP